MTHIHISSTFDSKLASAFNIDCIIHVSVMSFVFLLFTNQCSMPLDCCGYKNMLLYCLKRLNKYFIGYSIITIVCAQKMMFYTQLLTGPHIILKPTRKIWIYHRNLWGATPTAECQDTCTCGWAMGGVQI